jgi:hypothetical protein
LWLMENAGYCCGHAANSNQVYVYCIQQRTEYSVCVTASTLWPVSKIIYYCGHAANREQVYAIAFLEKLFALIRALCVYNKKLGFAASST